MILVIEMEVLADFQENQRNELLSLTAKDQIYLITKEDGVFPVCMLPLFTKISAKLEVKTLPKGDSGFEKGFLYGSLSKTSGKEEVRIFSKEPSPFSLPENCTWNEGLGTKARRKSTKSPKSDKVPANAKAPSEKPETQDKFFSSPALADCNELIKGKEDVFKRCVADASDAEIGYKMLLSLNFGTDGDVIWEKTHKHFKKLRNLL